MADALFFSVALLLHCDGSNGSTTFTDNSPSPKTVTAYNGAAVSTSTKLFGTGSCDLDGTDAYLSIPDAADWDVPGDKTIEVAFRTRNASGVAYTKGIAGTGTFGSDNGWAIGHYQGTLSVRVNSTAYSGSGTVSVNTWHRVALVWSGTSFKVYLDGAQIYSGTAETVSTSTALIVGNVSPPDANRYFDGCVDEIRVTNANARYTAAYTPATEAFPDTPEAIDSYVAAPGPLGAMLAIGGITVDSLVSAGGPLQQPSARAWHLYGQASADTMLGAVLALGTHDFTAQVLSSIRYAMDLITPGGAVRVPIESWQATQQTDSMSYAQCVIPACAAWVASIEVATEFVISRLGTATDGTAIEYEMVRAPVQTVSLDRGAHNYTATISGYTDAATDVEDPDAALDRTMTGIRTTSRYGALTRARCDVDWLLRPGQRAWVDELPIVVRYVNYYVTGLDQYMDIGDRA